MNQLFFFVLFILTSIVAAQTTIFSDSFESAFSSTWFVGNDGGTTGRTWGRNAYRANGTSSASAYCAESGSEATSTYINDLHTYMEKRSVNLSTFTGATLQFYYYLNTEVGHDSLSVNVRDQQNIWHHIWGASGNSNGWTLKKLDLSNFAGQTGLYVQFRFDSDPSTTGAGAWVDDIMLLASTKGNLRIQVQDQNGTLVPAATVVRFSTDYTFIDSLKTDSQGYAQWNTIDLGNYNMEAYSNGPSPFTGGEFWSSAIVTVTAGTTTQVLQRDAPFAQTFVIKDAITGQVLNANATIPPNSKIRLEATVINKRTYAQTIKVRFLLDRDQATPYDVDLTTTQSSLSGNNSTSAFSIETTLSSEGIYKRALEVLTLTNGNFSKTDGWDWLQWISVVVPKGTIQTTVLDLNGAAQSNATLILYDADYKKIAQVIATTGSYAWTDLPIGTYNLEVYTSGASPFPGQEFWTSATASVSANSTTVVRLQRNAPFAQSILFRDKTNNVTLSPPMKTTVGNVLGVCITIKNNCTWDQRVRVTFLADRDHLSPYDLKSTTNEFTVKASTDQISPEIMFTPNIDGTYGYAILVETFLNNAFSATDRWDWNLTAGNIQVSPLGSISVDNYFFDDFTYSGIDSLQLFGWTVVDGEKSPGNGLYSNKNVSFEKVQPLDPHSVVLSSKTGSTTMLQTQTRIETTSMVFLKGTYAARVCFTDSPHTYSDRVVETFYAINDKVGKKEYSECDFEYLPWDFWSGETDHSPKLWQTTWAIAWPNDQNSDRDTSPLQASYAGWHNLLFQAVDGVNVRYFVDGALASTQSKSTIGPNKGSSVFPDDFMQIALANWISTLSSSGQTYVFKCDWVYYAKDVALSPAQVDALVNNFRTNKVPRQNKMSTTSAVQGPKSIPFKFNFQAIFSSAGKELTLKISLPKESHIKISLFDIKGRCISNLFNGQIPSGIKYLKCQFPVNLSVISICKVQTNEGDFIYRLNHVR